MLPGRRTCDKALPSVATTASGWAFSSAPISVLPDRLYPAIRRNPSRVLASCAYTGPSRTSPAAVDTLPTCGLPPNPPTIVLRSAPIPIACIELSSRTTRRFRPGVYGHPSPRRASQAASRSWSGEPDSASRIASSAPRTARSRVPGASAAFSLDTAIS